MIALQRTLNADLLVALRTAPGHSFRNPVEKVNSILNLGLHGIGVMRQSIYEDMVFEKNLHTCSNLEEVRKLLNQKPTHADLYKKSCEPCVNLIKDSFSHLKLKDNSFQIFDVVNDNEVNQIRAQINLDKDITGRETGANLPDHPKLKAFLDHCTRQRTYFFSIKKCGKVDCTTYLPPRLPPDVFDRLGHQIQPPILQMKTITNLLAILMALKQPKL